jgi:hypothetical protein
MNTLNETEILYDARRVSGRAVDADKTNRACIATTMEGKYII